MNPDTPALPTPTTPQKTRRVFAHSMAWIVLAISLTASAGGWFIARKHENLTARKKFDEEVSRIQMALSEHMSVYDDVLHGGVGLYAASSSVERSEWKAYVDSVMANRRFPGMDGLGFIACVPRAKLDAFLQATRADKTPDFQLKNPGTNDDFFITKYFEPETVHAAMLGVDAGADPERRAAAEKARDTGRPVISGRLSLVGPDAKTQSGLLMLLPVFRNGTPAATLAERRAGIEGWVYARFITAQLMGDILKDRGALLRLEVFDRMGQGKQTLVFDSDPPATNQRNIHPPRFSTVNPLEVGQHLWLLRYSTKPAFNAAVPRSSEMFVAVGGSVISLLLFGIALSLSTTRVRAMAMANDMTTAFQKANAGLQKEMNDRERAQEELRHEQFLLRTLMDNLPDRIYFKDTQSRFLRNSRAHLQRFGLTRASEAIGKSDFDFFTEEHARQAFGDEQQLMRGGEPITKEEKETWPDGSVSWALSTKMPLRDEAGNVVGTFGISHDITDRKRAEEVMRVARDEAEEASRTKSQFLANMSHELRTPLNSVIGFAGILLKNKTGNLHPSDINFLERIQANGKHLLVLINEILDLSKIEARKVELKMEPVALDVLVRDTIAQQEALVRDRPVQLLADLPATVAPIQVDADKLRQVIINLIGNALKFTARGSVTVRVVTHPASHQPVRIEVIDTGIGIPEEKLGMIFQAFQQADASTARKYGGTGLGLTISQALCQLMGCRIEVTSEVGRGSTFSVILSGKNERITTATDPATTAVASTKIPAVQKSSDLHGKLVLVIDDESDSRVLLTHMLEEFGCQVIAANSGEQGLRMAREFKPQLITVDLLMPQMDGASVIREIKADPRLRAIPLVVVSVVAEERRGSILGAVEILEKPVAREDLLAALERSLLPDRAKILVVDDEEDSRRILLAHLADEPVEVRTAANGQEALTALETFTPDLVLLDLIMPVMDGMTFLDTLRTDPRHQHLKVVIISSKELSEAEKDKLRRQTLEIVRKTELSEEKFKQLLQWILKTQAMDERRNRVTTG